MNRADRRRNNAEQLIWDRANALVLDRRSTMVERIASTRVNPNERLTATTSATRTAVARVIGPFPIAWMPRHAS